MVSAHYLLLIIKNDADKTINNTKTNREAQRQSAIKKVNFPPGQVGKKAPKYGSQSETTIDSCP